MIPFIRNDFRDTLWQGSISPSRKPLCIAKLRLADAMILLMAFSAAMFGSSDLQIRLEGPDNVDLDCEPGFRCDYNECIEKPDPCNPNPCGMLATCSPNGQSYHCECPRGTFGDGFVSCQQGECLKDPDCAKDKACMDFFCINPCLMNSTCRAQDFCKVINHISVCGSNQGPQPEARTPVVIGGRYNPIQARPETRNSIVIGGQYSGTSRGSSECLGTRCGDQPSGSIIDARRPRPRVIGLRRTKRNPIWNGDNFN
eukprot:maker-scaffold723_size106546-snap-gene-0.18 protein:Tk01426 transcript:maker-scaffold723_size106546-snap-gene-0.18-mRNA-1 annotation:"hypothetical protein SINV_03269"